MSSLIKALLEFLFSLFKKHDETPTTSNDVPPNSDDAADFKQWVRDREKGGFH